MTAFNARTGTPCASRALQPVGQFGPWSLAHAVAAAARTVDERIITLVGESRATGTLGARMLLAVLAFCYARQIYGSTEVAARLRYDEALRRMCGELIPDADTIGRFRSENRRALDFCLQAALRFQAEEKVAQGLLAKVNEQHVAEEARRRITMAMFTDSLELEKERAATQVSFAS